MHSHTALPIAALGLVAVASASAPAVAQIDRQLARSYFVEVEAAARSHPTLWPVPLYGPLFFADRSSREVVANMPDTEGKLRREGDVWVGSLPVEMVVFNGATEWAGRRWTMLAWPPTRARYDRVRLLAHELFHRIQPELGHPGANPDNSHLDTEIGRTWLRLEWRALQAALGATGEARRRAMNDALMFRAVRHARIPGSRESEIALELNEGLAEYTGVMIAVPAPAHAGWALRLLDVNDASASTGSIVRNFAYASGPAYGLLLDAASPGWRARLRPDGDLGALVAAAYRLNPDSTEARALTRLGPYAGDMLMREEAARTERRVAEQARYRRLFLEGPTVTLAGTPKSSFSFDPNGVVPLDGVGTVYIGTSVTDEWGRLEVRSPAAALAVRDSAGVRFVVSAPADATGAPTRGDGWTLTLADGWELVPAPRAGSWVVRRRP